MPSHDPYTLFPANRLLAALPPDSLDRLASQLQAVELPFRKVLHEASKPITTVYFPTSGWALHAGLHGGRRWR